MKCVSFAWMGGRGVHCEYWLSWGWWPSLLTLSSPASPQPPSVCVPLSIWCISLPFCWCTSTSLCWFGDHFFRLSFCCIYFTLPHASLHRPPKNLFSHPNIWFCSQPWSKLVNGPNTNKVEEQKFWQHWKRNRNSLYTIKQFMSDGLKYAFGGLNLFVTLDTIPHWKKPLLFAPPTLPIPPHATCISAPNNRSPALCCQT